ncbi:MAG: hypothetical protein KKF68_02005 [Nanoarchaeota archaeon]|nr:hypothetical protein [Nanoarchaeota archaeon]
MKKRLLILISGLLSLNLVRAYNPYYGSSFSFSNILNSIESSTMILGSIFLLSFIFLNFALAKFFQQNKAAGGITAIIISLLITWGINRSGFNIEGLFYNIGFSTNFISSLIPFLLLAGIIFLIYRFRENHNYLFILGGLFILVSLTGLIYSSGTILIIGLILIAIRFFMGRERRPRRQTYQRPYL